MKNTLWVSKCLCILFLISCENATISYSTNDGVVKEKVEGNGQLSSEERVISTFNKINIEGVFTVFLSQGDKGSVKVETDENIQPLILVFVDNEVLYIKMKDSSSISKMKKINIYIHISDIRKLTTTGVGKLTCINKLNLKQLYLNCKGVGVTELKIAAKKLVIESEIVGLLNLSGEVKEADIKHNGLGAIKAFDLKTEKLKLVTEGIGAVEVYATNELTIDMKGLGGVSYKGNPPIKHIKKEGLGKVESSD